MGKRKKGLFNEYKGRMREEIQSFCRENGIKDDEFHFLPINNWQNVYDKILENFADYEWRRYHGLHWLNTNGIGNLKKDVLYAFNSYEHWDWVLKLPQMLGGKYDKLYYVAEEGGGQRSKFWIGEGTPEVIAKFLYEELYDDDYYIVDKKFQWMITCNHHCGVRFIGEEIGYVAEACKTMIEGLD